MRQLSRRDYWRELVADHDQQLNLLPRQHPFALVRQVHDDAPIVQSPRRRVLVCESLGASLVRKGCGGHALRDPLRASSKIRR